GEDAETLVSFTLAEAPDGATALTIVHENFADEQSCALHVQGWNDCLDRLVAVAAGLRSDRQAS
ncbi:MAG: SRPBCC domain-containing protein, partial [Leifsonia sp.]|nr:SRPBCC domain-containing protein [Leifsonia sp.]